MRNMTEEDLTKVVLERYSTTPNARLREVLQSLIRYSHNFVREVRLTARRGRSMLTQIILLEGKSRVR
jgi:Catechol dioxygenase N terminus